MVLDQKEFSKSQVRNLLIGTGQSKSCALFWWQDVHFAYWFQTWIFLDSKKGPLGMPGENWLKNRVFLMKFMWCVRIFKNSPCLRPDQNPSYRRRFTFLFALIFMWNFLLYNQQFCMLFEIFFRHKWMWNNAPRLRRKCSMRQYDWFILLSVLSRIPWQRKDMLR